MITCTYICGLLHIWLWKASTSHSMNIISYFPSCTGVLGKTVSGTWLYRLSTEEKCSKKINNIALYIPTPPKHDEALVEWSSFIGKPLFRSCYQDADCQAEVGIMHFISNKFKCLLRVKNSSLISESTVTSYIKSVAVTTNWLYMMKQVMGGGAWSCWFGG